MFVVITGSTRGIGRGMTEAFLARGHRVFICGRNPHTVSEGVETLRSQYGVESVNGQACDVTDPEQIQALWQAALSEFGRIDIWINNAGITLTQRPLWQQDPAQLQSIIHTNLLGVTYGSRVAIKGMLDQEGGGSIYNMTGLGSNGIIIKGLIPYGTTKAAVDYLTKGLTKEVADTQVQVGRISPGMVLTDLLTADLAELDEEQRQRTERIMEILAEPVEVIAPWIVDSMLKNRHNGHHIVRMTKARMATRFLLSPLRKNKRPQSSAA